MPATPVHLHVERMLDEIHHHYNQEVTLTALGRVLRRQPAYLGRLFRDRVGVTVHDYVTRARMVFGASQVRAGVKIEAVALDLGYRSKKNFYRQFHRCFGMTPDAYRHDATCGTPFSHPGPATGDRLRSDGLDDGMTTARARRGADPAMLVTDGLGCYVGGTGSAVTLTGYSADELRGMRTEVLFPNGCGSNTRSRVQVLRAACTALPATAVLRTKSGRRIRLHLTNVANLLARVDAQRDTP